MNMPYDAATQQHAYAPPPAPPGYPPYPPHATNRSTNSMAIAALVCSLVLAPLGIIFGHISLSQIKRTGQEGRGLAIAGLAIGYVSTVLSVIALVGVLVFMASVGSALHRMDSRQSSSRTLTTSPRTSTPSTPDATARAIKAAQVGDCIRRVPGAVKSDGSREVTVSAATCGSSTATDKVIKRTTSTSKCSGGEWVQTTAYSPPIVLCLSKLR